MKQYTVHFSFFDKIAMKEGELDILVSASSPLEAYIDSLDKLVEYVPFFDLIAQSVKEGWGELEDQYGNVNELIEEHEKGGV